MVRLSINLTDGIDKPKKSAIIITTQEKRQNMINVGDTVMVGSRIGIPTQKAVVVKIIPANEYGDAMYRVRFPADEDNTNPVEFWVDAPLVWPDLTNSYSG